MNGHDREARTVREIEDSEELNSANNWVSMEMDPSPSELSDETPALANTLIATSWEIMKQRTYRICEMVNVCCFSCEACSNLLHSNR